MTELDSEFAQMLGRRRSDLATETAEGVRILQLGGAYVGDPVQVPNTPFELTGGETAIETFVCAPGTPVVPTGENGDLIAIWTEFAQEMSDVLYETADAFGIPVTGSGYLTASALPLPLVSHDPHFDDDRFVPNEGISVVATASTHGGTRWTTEPVTVPKAIEGGPVQVLPSLKSYFESPECPVTQADPGRIALLAQFGQLHSGPDLDSGDPTQLRTLFVFRSATEASGPSVERPRRRRRRA